MIKIKELSKKFNDKYAVADLSFEVSKGRVSGLLGPNGSGKTTTIRLMTGFLAPDSGDVFIDDVSVVESPKDVQKKIGYMPETNPLYEDMLISELFDFFANLKDIPRSLRKNAYDFVVDALDLGDVFYRPIKELSKGYKQRTGLAIAMLNKPDVLILDEPTEGLDPNQRTDIRKLIKNLSKDRTILISTHVMQEAQAVCDDLFIISNGKLVADGSTEELTKSLQNKKIFEIEIEGKNIEKEIKEIKGLDDIKIIASHGNKLSASVTVGDDVEFQPLLSELVAKHSWVVWKLSEKKEKLEDVFYKLTNAE